MVAAQPVTIEVLVDAIKQDHLPLKTFNRNQALNMIIDMLNGSIPQKALDVYEVEVKWAPSTICPNDALSIYTRKSPYHKEKEHIIACIDWDFTEDGCVKMEDIFLLGNNNIHTLKDIIELAKERRAAHV